MFSFFVMGAWTDDDDGIAAATTTPSGAATGLCGPALRVNVNDRITLNVEFGYNELNDYSLDADVNITVVPGFVVTPGIGFKHFERVRDDDNWGGYLRTQFTF